AVHVTAANECGREHERVAHPLARAVLGQSLLRAQVVQLAHEQLEARIRGVIDDVDTVRIATEAMHCVAHAAAVAEHERADETGGLETGDGVESTFVVALGKHDVPLECPRALLNGLAERDHVPSPSFRWSAVRTDGATNCAMSPPSDAISRTSDADR